MSNPAQKRNGAKASSPSLTFDYDMKEHHVLADNSNSAQRRNGMNAGMKLAAVYVAGAIFVAGCGQSNSGSAGTNKSGDSNQSLYDEYHSIICKIKTTNVTASDVARQMEINEEFKKLASNIEHNIKLIRAMDLETCK